ncbi:type I restriction enzyme HsdR N-terminal domain-containing protein [Laribacter hongkongensis]|uniref:type I restriction endonuclease n=1 Tax=Laribacter hongkongensis TaxID=168471 RepID=UPI001EFD9821|nr:type I restriction endonuclease [Laribacter hongkongensis]MCG9054745.1 type I restriction enzyme HsdR N-terminal domain-containing protein [Laribacter hongkongensis]
MTAAFKDRVLAHVEHIKKMGSLCSTEETTKQALILPLLDILGFSAFDPTKVKAEYQADFPGVKAGERVDYALFCHGVPVMFVEAKVHGEKLVNHCPQLSRYFNATPEVAVSAITNGKEWRFFTDLDNKNIMDAEPFLTIDLTTVTDADIQQLHRFRHDQFQPEALRTLAEESIYLAAFIKVISDSLRDVDTDFVRYVANRSSIQRQLNQRFLETITPLVRQAVERSVSAMVVSGLSASAKPQESPDDGRIEAEKTIDPTAPIVDPDNSRIVTTHTERQVFANAKLVLGDDADLHARDTESYFSVLYQGKTNRWLLRYFDNKQRPSIQLPFALSEQSRNEVSRAGLEIGAGEQIIIDRPENLLRLPGLLFDAYSYCSNDENFRRKQ